VLFRDTIGWPLNHYPAHILGTGISDKDTAVFSQLFLNPFYYLHDLRHRRNIRLVLNIYVDKLLGIYIHHFCEFRQGLACSDHGGKQLHGCNDTIAGSRVNLTLEAGAPMQATGDEAALIVRLHALRARVTSDLESVRQIQSRRELVTAGTTTATKP